MNNESVSSRTLKERAVSLLPNVLTFFAILCGLTSIRLSGEGWPEWASAAIFAAAVLDTADGYAARRLSAHSAIGAELDSLADFVNFGVAPAMLLYWTGLSALGGLGWLIAAVYVLSTGFRLARFNVQTKAASDATPAKWFCGLPSTGAAIAVLIADAGINALLQPRTASVLMAATAIAVSLLMLSTLRVPAPFKRYGIRSGNP